MHFHVSHSAKNGGGSILNSPRLMGHWTGALLNYTWSNTTAIVISSTSISMWMSRAMIGSIWRTRQHLSPRQERSWASSVSSGVEVFIYQAPNCVRAEWFRARFRKFRKRGPSVSLTQGGGKHTMSVQYHVPGDFRATVWLSSYVWTRSLTSIGTRISTYHQSDDVGSLQFTGYASWVLLRLFEPSPQTHLVLFPKQKQTTIKSSSTCFSCSMLYPTAGC